ncbi:MAG: ComEA family DNA-binding protein [Acidimicrobiales bacterium]
MPSRRLSPDVLWWAMPLGMTTWAGFAYLARRQRSPTLEACAICYGALAGLVVALSFFAGIWATLAGILLVVVWVCGGAHLLLTFARIRDAEDWLFEPDLVAARKRLKRRAAAKTLVQRDPALAREARLGRPGTGADWGVIDLNHSGAPELATYLEISPILAERIVAKRDEVGRFVSAEEVGALVDLPATLVDEIADRGVGNPLAR